MTESYWKIPQSDEARINVPLQVMKEQADLLTEQTSGLLQGLVSHTALGDTLRMTLSIRVPTLNRYNVELFEY